MRPVVCAAVFLAFSAGSLLAEEVPPVTLHATSAYAHLPGDAGWALVASTSWDTAVATRTLGPTQMLTAVLRVIPVTDPQALVTHRKRPREHLAEVLYGMGETLNAALGVPASGEPLIDASPWDYAGMWCLYYNALSSGVPEDAHAGSSRDMSVSGALCARIDPPAVIDMRIMDVRRMANDHYANLAMDAGDFFETLWFDPPAR